MSHAYHAWVEVKLGFTPNCNTKYTACCTHAQTITALLGCGYLAADSWTHTDQGLPAMQCSACRPQRNIVQCEMPNKLSIWQAEPALPSGAQTASDAVLQGVRMLLPSQLHTENAPESRRMQCTAYAAPATAACCPPACCAAAVSVLSLEQSLHAAGD